MSKRNKDWFACEFEKPVVGEGQSDGPAFTESPHAGAVEASVAAAPVDVPQAAPAPVPAPQLTVKGRAYLEAYWWSKLKMTCPRCGGPRFVNIYDVGAGYGPAGAQIGICAGCGEDLKLGKPQRAKLDTWTGR